MKSKHPHPPVESGKESNTTDTKGATETTPPAPPADAAEQAAAEIASLKDQLLRARADFENSRKRLMREKEESLRYANQAILADLLPLLDHLELGLQAASAGTDVASVVAGVKLIQSQFE